MKLNKHDAASHQLDVAIRLFLEGDYLASLTLAGAAEEILGSLSRQARLPVALEIIAAHHRKDTDPNLSKKDSDALIFNIANDARNSAKHDRGEAEVDVDQVHPLQMIMRAMPMRVHLGLPETAATRQMIKWIKENPDATR